MCGRVKKKGNPLPMGYANGYRTGVRRCLIWLMSLEWMMSLDG
jgi:hypothetical protein